MEGLDFQLAPQLQGHVPFRSLISAVNSFDFQMNYNELGAGILFRLVGQTEPRAASVRALSASPRRHRSERPILLLFALASGKPSTPAIHARLASRV
jgi:hypothetical protein